MVSGYCCFDCLFVCVVFGFFVIDCLCLFNLLIVL